MDQKELKEHFKRADKVVSKGISESKQNFDRLTDIIQRSYSEINKGELIIAAGAFSLIVTFLIQKDTVVYSEVIYLKLAICFLFFVVMWKFHISRTAVRNAEKERELTDEYLGLLKEVQVANTEYALKDDPSFLLKTPETFKKIDAIDKKRKEMNSPQSKFRNTLLNETEYVAFFIGTALLLFFFLSNI